MKEKVPKEQKKISSFFDLINIILEKKPYPSDEDIKKHCNPYMLNLTFSNDQQLAGIAHEMSKYRISNKMYFDCMYHGIPKCKKFIKFNSTKAKKEQDIVYMMEHFGVSLSIAKDYIKLIDETELQEIRDFYEKRGVIREK
jgi:hypothetical protein